MCHAYRFHRLKTQLKYAREQSKEIAKRKKYQARSNSKVTNKTKLLNCYHKAHSYIDLRVRERERALILCCIPFMLLG